MDRKCTQLWETSPRRFPSRFSSAGQGPSPRRSPRLRGRARVRLRREGCSLCKPEIPRVYRPSPAVLNPDCSPLVCSRWSLRYGAAGSRVPSPRGLAPPRVLISPPGTAAVGRSRGDSASPASPSGCPPPSSLVPSPPGGASPGMRTVHLEGRGGTPGRVGAPCEGHATQTTTLGAFSVCVEAKRGNPRVRCSSALRPPHGRAENAGSFVSFVTGFVSWRGKYQKRKGAAAALKITLHGV